MARVGVVGERSERELGELPCATGQKPRHLKGGCGLDDRPSLPSYNFGVRDQVVIVRLGDDEAKGGAGLRAGFYRSPLTPDQAEALLAELGLK